MRPNNGQRRGGRRNGGGGGGGHRHGGQPQGQQGQNRSAASLRNQIFDSNGPDMRVRGNAFQVHEKYQALAKDALSSGDRVLAENYLQHAEHYYRIIEAINEATAAEQRARQASWESQPQPGFSADGQPQGDVPAQEGQFSGNPYPAGEQQGEQQREFSGNRHQHHQQRRERFENRHQQQRYGNEEGQQQRYRGEEGHQQGQQHQNNPQYQQHGPASPAQSQDPLYDGVDEDHGDAQDVAIGGRR